MPAIPLTSTISVRPKVLVRSYENEMQMKINGDGMKRRSHKRECVCVTFTGNGKHPEYARLLKLERLVSLV